MYFLFAPDAEARRLFGAPLLPTLESGTTFRLAPSASSRVSSPLIKPDVPVPGSRLSDGLQRKAHAMGLTNGVSAGDVSLAGIRVLLPSGRTLALAPRRVLEFLEEKR